MRTMSLGVLFLGPAGPLWGQPGPLSKWVPLRGDQNVRGKVQSTADSCPHTVSSSGPYLSMYSVSHESYCLHSDFVTLPFDGWIAFSSIEAHGGLGHVETEIISGKAQPIDIFVVSGVFVSLTILWGARERSMLTYIQ